LLDASSISPRRLPSRNFERNAERCNFAFGQLIFTTPKFADEQVYFHAEWREKFITEVRPFSKTSLPTKLDSIFQIESAKVKLSFCHREAANGGVDVGRNQIHAT